MNFLKWYKHKIESNHHQPPKAIWDNIQNQLDIDNSWNVINNHLQKQAALRRRRWISAAAAILVLMLAGTLSWYWTEKQNIQTPELTENIGAKAKSNQTVERKDTASSTTAAPQENIVEDGQLAELKTKTPVNETDAENSISDHVTRQPGKSPKNTDEIRENEKNTIRALARVEGGINNPQNQDNILPRATEKQEIDNASSGNNKSFQHFYTGATGQLANTWLLNNKTYSSFQSSTLTRSNASFGSNFGFFVASNLTEKIYLHIDLNIIAHNRHNYNEYMNGAYVSNDMVFNYSQTGIALRYITESMRYLKGEHHIYTGGYWGYLHSASQIIDGEVSDIASNYKTNDFGVFLGYEYLFPLTAKLDLGTGIKALYGLNNIYSGDSYIPSYLNKTNNASFNITFSLKYDL